MKSAVEGCRKHEVFLLLKVSLFIVRPSFSFFSLLLQLPGRRVRVSPDRGCPSKYCPWRQSLPFFSPRLASMRRISHTLVRHGWNPSTQAVRLCILLVSPFRTCGASATRVQGAEHADRTGKANATGTGWEAAFERASGFVDQLTLEEKVTLVTGTVSHSLDSFKHPLTTVQAHPAPASATSAPSPASPFPVFASKTGPSPSAKRTTPLSSPPV